MTAYATALACLLLALVGYLAAARALVARFFRQPGEAGRSAWLVLACAMLILAIAAAHAIELLLHTGLYDFRQAILSGLAGVFSTLAAISLTRR